MRLTHPDAKRPIEVDDDHAEIYIYQGWTEPAKTSADRAGTKKEAAPRRTTTQKEEA